MDLIKRLEELETKIDPPTAHVIFWRLDLGETKEQSIEKYKRENNIIEFDNRARVLIVQVLSYEQVQAELCIKDKPLKDMYRYYES